MLLTTPRISIGLSVCNGEKYLAETIEAILNQTVGDFELLIADNASTDATAEICQAYAAIDQRIQYHRSPDRMNDAENFRRILQLATGVYFQSVGQRDRLAPTYVATCCAVLDRDPAVVLTYTRLLFVDEAGRPQGVYSAGLHLTATRPGDRLGQILARPNVSPALSGLIRTDILRKTALLQPTPPSERLLLMRLSLHGKLYEVPEPLLLRRGAPILSGNSLHQPSLSSWQQRLAYVRLLQGAGLPMGEQIDCYAQLARFFIAPRRIEQKFNALQ